VLIRSDIALIQTTRSCSGRSPRTQIDTRGFEFEHVLRDFQTLNEWALDGKLETTAIPLHTYPYVQDRYAVLPPRSEPWDTATAR